LKATKDQPWFVSILVCPFVKGSILLIFANNFEKGACSAEALGPFFLTLSGLQSFEHLLVSSEIVVDGGGEQRLSEAPLPDHSGNGLFVNLL